ESWIAIDAHPCARPDAQPVEGYDVRTGCEEWGELRKTNEYQRSRQKAISPPCGIGCELIRSFATVPHTPKFSRTPTPIVDEWHSDTVAASALRPGPHLFHTFEQDVPSAVSKAQSFFHLHLISDATGETLLAAGRAASAQYK